MGMITALIDGKLVMVDESTLTPNHSVVDNEREHTEVTEFLFNGEVVHRSVHVTLKQGLGIEPLLGQLG